MVNEQLLDYIKQQLSLKVSKEAIAVSLKGTGWNDADIAEAFAAIAPVSTPTPASTPVPMSPTSSMSSAVAQPTVAQGAMYNDFPRTAPKSKKVFSIIAVLVLLCALGAGAYAYYADVFFSLPEFKKEVMSNLKDVKTVTFDINTNIDFSGIKDSETPELDEVFGGSSRVINLNMKGSVDSIDTKDTKLAIIYGIALGSTGAEVEFRVLGNTVYGSLTKAPVIPAFPIPMLSEYEDKWFHITYKTDDGEIVASPLSSIGGIEETLAYEFTPEQEEKLNQIFLDSHAITNLQKLPSEKVGDQSSYHFTFDLDREGLVAYLTSTQEYIATLGENQDYFSEFDSESLRQMLDKIKDFSGEIWIGEKDKLVNKFALKFAVIPEDNKPDEKLKISVEGLFSAWDQPVSITAPAESIPFETFISNILSDSMLGGIMEEEEPKE